MHTNSAFYYVDQEEGQYLGTHLYAQVQKMLDLKKFEFIDCEYSYFSDYDFNFKYYFP